MSAGNGKRLAERGGVILVALDVGTERRNLRSTHGSHVRRRHDLAQLAERANEDRQIGRVTGSAEVQGGLNLGIGRLDGDLSTAEGLQDSKHD